jgi:hypothetical protein
MANESDKPDTGDTTTTPAGINPQDLANLVNSAVSAHLKRHEAKQSETLKSLIAESLKAYQPPQTQQEEPETSKRGKVDPQVAALTAKVEEFQRAALESEKRAQAAETKARGDRAFGELRSTLAGKVRPDVVDGLAKLLYHGEQKVEVDENGNVLFKVRRAPLPGFPEEDALMPLSDGVEQYLKSKEAAAFLPAPVAANAPQARTTSSRFPQTQSPSAGPKKYDAPAKSDEEKVRRAHEMEQYLAQTGKF